METPEFYYGAAPPSADKINDHFLIDDLLDFPTDDANGDAAAFTDSSAADTSGNSSSSAAGSYFQAADVGGPHGIFSNELCVPYDEMAELEWVSSFVDESFSSEDLQKLHLIQGLKARTNELPRAHQYHFQPETGPNPTPLSDVSVPAKARSKRSRAAPGNWASRVLMVSPPSTPAAGLPESDIAAGKKPPAKPSTHKKRDESSGSGGGAAGEGRKCLHCATDRTPQWRTGPMGPKTLCNACGVRFKSGRLVPEYRPASSPTFVLTKHSNSHRKVLELRRQKEMQHQQFLHHHHHRQTMMFDVSNGGDFLIHPHIGPDFRQLIRD